MAMSVQVFVNSLTAEALAELETCISARKSDAGLQDTLFQPEQPVSVKTALAEFMTKHGQKVKELALNDRGGIMAAIKYVRAQTQRGLKEAKDAIDAQFSPGELANFYRRR